MQVLMSNEAHEDIDSIFEYISRDSIKYANETSENIYSRIYELENAPYLGRYVPELLDKHFRELISYAPAIYKHLRIRNQITSNYCRIKIQNSAFCVILKCFNNKGIII